MVLRFGHFNPQYRSLLTFSLPLMVSSALWTLFQQIDNILLGYYATSFEVGIYDGMFLLARLLVMVLGSFGFLFMPIFSELQSEDKHDRMSSVYHSVTEWATLLVLPLFISMVIIPESILTVLFQASYSLAAPALVIVSTGFFVHILSGLSGDALIALGRTRIVLVGNASAAVLNLALNMALIPPFGVTGAAVASASAYALFNLFFLAWLHRETGILPFSISFMKPVSISSIAIGLFFSSLKTVIDFNIISVLLVLILSYFLHTFILIRTKKITTGDKQIMDKLESKFDVEIQTHF